MAWTLTHRIIMILHFLDFWSYISFWCSSYNVLVTIFGNVHRPCKHYFIIVNNGIYSFFPHFLAIFTSVTILGNVHRPCNQCIKIIKRVYIMSILFFLIFPDLFIIFAWITIFSYLSINYHIRKCVHHVNNAPTSLTKIYICLFIFSWFFLIFWVYLS